MVKLTTKGGIQKGSSSLEGVVNLLGVRHTARHLSPHDQLLRLHVKAVIRRPDLGAVVTRGPQRLVRHAAELALGDVDKVRPHRHPVLTEHGGGEAGQLVGDSDSILV